MVTNEMIDFSCRKINPSTWLSKELCLMWLLENVRLVIN